MIPDKSELISIGKIIKAHNNKGTLKVYPLTDFPEHFQLLKEVFVVGTTVEKVLIEKASFHKQYILLKLFGYNNQNDTKDIQGAMIAIEKKELWPLGDCEYYYFDLIGLLVVTDEGRVLGKIDEIFPTGSNDVYVIKDNKKEYMLPAIKDVIKKVDIEKGVMQVHLLEGLID